MTELLPPVRRIVTANGSAGRSFIAEDGPPRAVKTIPTRPGYQVANLWVTQSTPCDPNAPDASREHSGILPPPGGTVIRVIDFPPETGNPEDRARALAATFKQLYPDVPHDAHGGRHPGMHTTATVDYAIVLHGEIYAVMDEGETLMRAGDILVQRATSHAWSNRSGKPCRICFVLIDGQRGPVR